MNRAYKVNYSIFALLLTPIVLRGKLLIAMLSSFVRPLESLHAQFIGYMDLVSAKTGAQTCYLRAILNDEFDFFSRRIIVRVIPLEKDSFLLWSESSNKPVMLSADNPFLLNRDGQTGSNSEDFEVVLPRSWTLSNTEESRMKRLINTNKLASKKYKIVYE